MPTDLPLTKISETSRTITLGWTPPPGCRGYIFWTPTKKSSSSDGAQKSARFSKPGPYTVEALGTLASGAYPPVVVPPPPPPPPPSSGTLYGVEDFEDGMISSPWQGSQFFPTGTLSPRVVADPLGQRGKVLLLQADYAALVPTDYTSAALQQTAISINPQYAHAGMGENGQPVYSGMDTWYGFYLMAPVGNVFCCGESNYLTEWHSTTGGVGPKSSGMFAFGGYPLGPNGTTVAKIMHRETVDAGGGNYQNVYFPGGYSDPNQAVPGAPTFTLGMWHDVVFHKYWSPDKTVGLVEWWLNGVKLASKSLQTQATNDYYTWAFYNYRYNVKGSSRLYYDDLRWGSSAASIGFTP